MVVRDRAGLRPLVAAIAELAGDADITRYSAAETAAGGESPQRVVQQRKASAHGSFMEWICSQETAGDAQQQTAAPAQLEPLSQHRQQQELQTQMQRPSAAVAAAKALESAKGDSRKDESSPMKSAAASGRGRVRSAKQSKAAAGMPAGALDRFVNKQQQQQRQQETAFEQQQQASTARIRSQQQVEQQQPQWDSSEAAADMCVSPEMLPLAVRLARNRAGAAATAAAAGVGRQTAEQGPPAAGAGAVDGGGTVCGLSPMPPPAKKASTVREKERLCSPASSPQKLQDSQAGRSVIGVSSSSSPRQQQLQVEQNEPGASAPKQLHTYFTTQYQALMDDVAELSPHAQGGILAPAAAVSGQMPSMAASRLFAKGDGKQQEEIDVIDLLDSPVPLSSRVYNTTAVGSRKCPAAREVVDLT